MSEDAGNILICGANWLGDSVMSMPAIQAFKQKHPGCRVSLLVKPDLAPLWQMHGEADEVLSYDPDHTGTFRVAGRLRRGKFDAAYVFPNSFRSAFMPFLARIRPRIGFKGHWRRFLLTDIADKTGPYGGMHQSQEYMGIMQVEDGDTDSRPRLRIPLGAVDDAARRFGLDRVRKHVALFPGAARGASKRWPEDHFADTGHRLARGGHDLLILGSAREADLCQRITDAAGHNSFNLAGRTSLSELAAVLSLCAAVVSNDSGGMHLATAAGARVVAIFGATDPSKTGPLGAGHKVISADAKSPSRDIARESAEAAAHLRSISPDRIIAAVREILAEHPAM